MRATVLAWSDRGGLEKALASSTRFQTALHLCATGSLFRGLSKAYGKQAPFALSIGKLIEHLCPRWFAARTQLEQYIHLTGILHELNRRYPASARELRALRRGQRGLLEALRDLVQAGLRPSDVQPSSDAERMACRAWELLEEKPRFTLPRARLYEEFVNAPGTFSKSLMESLAEVLREAGTGFHLEQIVLHGFYFITPIQLQLMRLLEAAGSQLVFCNFYDPRFPAACRAWESFFKPEFGLPPPSAWTHFPAAGEPAPFAQEFGSALEGKDLPPTPALGITFEEFNDLSGFARTLSSRIRPGRKRKTVLLSPGSEELTGRLAEFLPEMTDGKRRHLLSYPVGRFLLHLHRMWNADRASLDIDEIALLECVGSGWMRLDGRDARGFLPTLERLLPYFAGCRSLEDWLGRASRLQEARQALVTPFAPPTGSGTASDRYQRFLGSPFERLSFFAVPDAGIDAFKRLLLDLHDLARTLFANPEAEVSQHFRRLEQLLRERVSQSLLIEEEQKLIEVLSRSLQAAQSVELAVPREDLCEAVTLFLSGRLERPPEGEQISGVRHFSHLDGVPLEYKDAELHVAMCDDEQVPHRYVGFAWPFTRESFKPTAPIPRQSHAFLQAREDSSLDADVLLLFQAAALADKLTLSWIRNRDGKELGPSPLLLPVLQEFGPHPIQDPTKQASLGEPPPAVPAAPGPAGPHPAAGTHPPQALATWSICPRRFFYDFVLAEGPAWRSEFHHAFLLGNIVRGVEHQFHLEGQAFQHLQPYLPHWPAARLKDACERAPYPPEGRFAYQGRLYPRFLDRLILYKNEGSDAGTIQQVLAGEGQAKVLSELTQQLQREDGRPLPTARPSAHCTRCPHQHHCGSALFHHELTGN